MVSDFHNCKEMQLFGLGCGNINVRVEGGGKKQVNKREVA
jgi:hypothetical protein